MKSLIYCVKLHMSAHSRCPPRGLLLGLLLVCYWFATGASVYYWRARRATPGAIRVASRAARQAGGQPRPRPVGPPGCASSILSLPIANRQ